MTSALKGEKPLDASVSVAELRELLAQFDPTAVSERTTVTAALKVVGEPAYVEWRRWAYTSDGSCRAIHTSGSNVEDAARAEWKAAAPNGDGVGFLYAIAESRGWTRSAAEEIPLPPRYCEERLAARFTARHGRDWRYVAEWARWFSWGGTGWRSDSTLHAFDLARGIAREAATEASVDDTLRLADRVRVATAIASARTVSAIERLARADRVHALTADAWDRDIWLLNTPSGVIDLRTGERRVHQREDYMTKTTGGAPGGACPTWQAFLRRVTGEDTGLERFLQRFIGYCLTGSTREHALLFLYGLGGNGKSTFLVTLQGALGDYATSAPMETFVETHSERHPTDLAMLRGARLVVAQEVEDGQRWAVSRIKQLTGGDVIRARFMRQDYFEYAPQFKLILAGNHKPSFRQVDEAIRRRFLLVPFTQTIGAHERDAQLVEKLRAEWPGVLGWALAGCKAWQAEGLNPPECVRAATQAYLEDEDVLRTWLSEACDADPNAFEAVADLHASYQAWAERAAERFIGMKRFSQALEDHGFRRHRGNGKRVRGFLGLRLRQPQQRRFEAVR